jgi:hypothetical protein
VKQMLVGVALVIASSQQSSCPTPTKAVNTAQRKTPFFKVLIYELLESAGGGSTTVWVFEDVAGHCYVTSGVDGGISVVPATICAAAKHEAVEVVAEPPKVEPPPKK